MPPNVSWLSAVWLYGYMVIFWLPQPVLARCPLKLKIQRLSRCRSRLRRFQRAAEATREAEALLFWAGNKELTLY